MMKIVLIYLALIFYVSGCATTLPNSSRLYGEFSRYESTASEDNIFEVAEMFFSTSLLGKDYRSNPDAAGQLLFKNYMAVTQSHYEKVIQGDGCLTINGYDEDNAPLIFSLKYIPNEGHWLIDGIHVVYIENTNDFASSAKCPSEYAN
jgi:hypothetical protein